MNVSAGKSLAAYREEARKCVLVCANCHGEIEAGLIPSPPAGARYGDPWPGPAPSRARAADGPREVEGYPGVTQLELDAADRRRESG